MKLKLDAPTSLDELAGCVAVFRGGNLWVRRPQEATDARLLPSRSSSSWTTRCMGRRAFTHPVDRPGRSRRSSDFITSPEVGLLFGAVLARHLDAERIDRVLVFEDHAIRTAWRRMEPNEFAL